MLPRKLDRILCTNCTTFKKGTLAVPYENTQGLIELKCSKCGAITTLDLYSKKIIEVKYIK